jgi:bacteriocin-like protein
MKKLTKNEMKKVTGGIAPPCYWECRRKRLLCLQYGYPEDLCLQQFYDCNNFECDEEIQY